jgi:hypothetical protein
MQEQSKDFNDFRKQEIKEAKKFWDKILSLDFPELFGKEPEETKIEEPEEIHMVEAKSGMLCANCDHEEYYHKNDSGVARRCIRFGEHIYVNKSTNACRCEDFKLKDLQNVVFDKNGNKHIE